MKDRKFDMMEIHRLTNIDSSKRGVLMRYFCQMPENKRLNVIQIQSSLIRKHHDEGRLGFWPEFTYAMLLRALSRLYDAKHMPTAFYQHWTGPQGRRNTGIRSDLQRRSHDLHRGP